LWRKAGDGSNIQKDDEIVVTWLEHHANIVPWQMLCAEKGARLRVAPVDDSGQVLLDEYEKLLGPKTRLVSIAHVSNALGTVVPVKEMVEAAHRHGARVLVDGAQAVSHMRVDVQAINCDFYVFSGHKVFAPTGIGVVYGKSEVLDNDAAMAGRRQHDPGCHLREDALPTTTAALRSRYRQYRRCGRTGRGD
jgi:cysteine desulfurase / selenocysteine lyase